MAGFQGYYIKNTANNKIFPVSILKDGGDGYHATPHIITDKDAYTDGTGETHRTPLQYTKAKIWLNTVDTITEAQKLQIQECLNNPVNMSLQWWNDHTHAYQTDRFYMTEIDWKHDRFDPDTYEITYKGVSITLIAYKSEAV